MTDSWAAAAQAAATSRSRPIVQVANPRILISTLIQRTLGCIALKATPADSDPGYRSLASNPAWNCGHGASLILFASAMEEMRQGNRIYFGQPHTAPDRLPLVHSGLQIQQQPMSLRRSRLGTDGDSVYRQKLVGDLRMRQRLLIAMLSCQGLRPQQMRGSEAAIGGCDLAGLHVDHLFGGLLRFGIVAGRHIRFSKKVEGLGKIRTRAENLP